MNRKLYDRNLVGQRFSRWTVTALSGMDSKGSRWLCLCDCGTSRVVSRGLLTDGASRSCGCLKRELLSKRVRTGHGEASTKTRTTEYRIWANIKDRCFNQDNHAYPRYGGRGIIMCERWRESYEAFLLDVGRRPSADHTIDRFPDNDGNYEPGNVRWATYTEQNNNRRDNRRITIGETTLNFSQWIRLSGMSESQARRRISRGWGEALAVITPPSIKIKPKEGAEAFWRSLEAK